jgi:hypothetical protein
MLATLIGAVFVLLIVVGLLYCVRLLLLLRILPVDIVEVVVILLAIIALVWMLTRYGIVSLP